MRCLISITLFFFYQIAAAQSMELRFGFITAEEQKMSRYEKDPDAKAVILYDKGTSKFIDTKDGGYDIRFTRHKRIKIFDKSDTRNTEVSIPFYVDGYGKTEKITELEAVTYNYINGKEIRKPLVPSAVYEEKINERWHVKKFVFPDVQNGAILEYRYELETPFHFNLPDWTFQDRIPTIYSEYEVNMIPFYEYVFIAQGISKWDYQRSEEAGHQRWFGSGTLRNGYAGSGSGIEFYDMRHTYVLKDVPAFTDESYITSINDYIVKMDFQLAKLHKPTGGTNNIISTWPDLNASLLRHEKFGKYLKGCSRFAKKVLEELGGVDGMDQDKAAQTLVDYVKQNFEWNGFLDKYAPQSPTAFYSKKSGNSAEINLFMIALLQEAGIQAEPLILSTRNHGKIRGAYPYDHFTNYVVAYVPAGTTFLADATEDKLPYNKLPTRCNNGLGLLVQKGKEPQWISLENTILSVERNQISMSLDSVTRNINAMVSIQSSEYAGLNARSRFQDNSQKIEDYYTGRIGEVEKMRTMAYDRSNLPYSMNFQTTWETDQLGNTVVIRPFMNLPLSKNELRAKQRSYPVDFIYPWEDQFKTTITIPEGFSVLEMPEGMSQDDELVEIKLQYTFSNGVIIAEGNYKFKKAIYQASEYSSIKLALDKIVQTFNKPLILEANSNDGR